MRRPIYDLASVFAEQVKVAEEESLKVYEAVIGIVKDNQDPLKLGRVKVVVPVLSEADTTYWLPIIMLGASQNRGWFFIPEPEDEVLIMFEHGDMDHGLVVGALWNGVDAPPDANPDGTNPHRVFKSRAGSRVMFDDSPQPKLFIEDGTGNGRITIDTFNNKIVIEAMVGDVCFQCPTDTMTIVAQSAEFIAGDNLEIHAGGNMAWGTDANAKITGSAGVTISGSQVNLNCGNAKAPPAPTGTVPDVDDPYGS